MANIHNMTDDTIISGSSGADSIYSEGSNVVIVGGKGNDIINLSSTQSGNNVIQYALGDGNDTVQNLRTNDLIHITNGSYSTSKSGNDVIVSVGSGKITLKDAASIRFQIKNSSGTVSTINPNGAVYLDNSIPNTVISGSDYNDTIHSRVDRVTINSGYGDDYIMNWGGKSETLSVINAGSGNDDVWNYAEYITVNAGYGADTVRNWGNYAELNAESGNDYIWCNAQQVTINGGSGDDTIINQNAYATIEGGTGNDIIRVSSDGDNEIRYAHGDGYDEVYGLKFNDLIHITSGSYYTWTYENHLMIELDYGGIALAYAANRKLRVKNSSGNIDFLNPYGAVYTKNHTSNTEILGSYYADTIYNDADSVTINSGYDNDNVNNQAANVTIFSGLGNDTISNSYVYDPVSHKCLPSNALIYSGAGNDKIYNSGDNSTLVADTGNDTISNYGGHVSLSSGADNDSIESFGDDVTINGGAGDDFIKLYWWRGTHSAAYSCSNLIQYASGDGNDTVQFIASTDLIHITSGSYFTQVSGNDVIVGVGSGKITLKDAADIHLQIKNSSGTIETINSTGKFYIRNNIPDKQIQGSDYADTIYNGASNITLDARGGNDTIRNDASASLSVIDGGPGNDWIINEARNVTLDGGAGDNTISNGASQVTIRAGAGNDCVSNINEYFQGLALAQIETGDGDDTVSNYHYNQVTIDAGEGNDSIRNSGGEYVSISGGAGSDTIEVIGEADRTTINGGAGSDTFVINLKGYSNKNFMGYSALIEDYESGKDKIVLQNASIESYSFDGNEVILSLSGEKMSDYQLTLRDVAGKEITFVDSDNSITKATYKEELDIWGIVKELGAKGLTVFLFLGKYKDHFADAKFVDARTTLTELLQITLDVVNKNQKVNGELIKTVTAKFTDLKNFVMKINTKNPIPVALIIALALHINNSLGAFDGHELTDKEKRALNLSYANLMKESIKVVAKVINFNTPLTKALGGADLAVSIVAGVIAGVLQALDSGDKYSEDGLPQSVVIRETAIDVLTEAIYEFNTTYTNGADDVAFEALRWVASLGEAFIKWVGTGDFDFDYTASEKNYMEWVATVFKKISISNRGDEDDNYLISLEDGEIVYADDGADYISNIASKVELYGGHGNDTIFSHGDANNSSIIGGYGNDLIYVAGNENIIHGESTYSAEKISFGSGYNDTIFVLGEKNLIYGDEGNDRFLINAKNNTVSGGKGDDVIIIDGSKNTVLEYNRGDGDDTIIGFDSDDTIKVPEGGTYKTVGKDIVISAGANRITLVGASNIASPKIITPRTASNTELPEFLTLNEKKLLITAGTKFTGTTIDLNLYSVGANNITAANLKSAVELVGNEADNSIKGGKGADTIYGGAGNDTVSLGGGADVYVYESGDDLIQDYAAADKIKLASASITGSSLSGSNVVLKTSAGNITVKGGKDKAITVIDKNGTETSKIYPESTTSAYLTYDSAKKTLTVGTSYDGAAIDLANFATTTKTVNASKFTKAIKITGTNRAESLVGGSRADTLIGGKGNDTLTGGNDNDIFVYGSGDGADVIADFTAGDKISLASGSVSSAALKNSDMTFKIGSGSITVKNAKGKDISIGGAIYHDNLIYDSKKTAVTVGSGFSGTLGASDYDSKTKTINATSVSKNIFIVGNSVANSIFGGSKADTIYGGTGADSIDGGAGNDKLTGEAGNDKLFGSTGNDSLFGGAGADTLTGGEGKDVFIYGAGDGKDVITDYTAGKDKIKISSGSISGYSFNGNNVIFSVGNGSITVQDGKGKKITIVDASGKSSTKTYFGAAINGRSALWFTNDDNFIANASTLDDLIQAIPTDYSSNIATATVLSAQSDDILQHITYNSMSYDNR